MSLRLLTVLTTLLIATSSWSAGPPAGVRTSLSYTPVYQFDTGITGGGSVATDHHLLHLELLVPLKGNSRLGISMRYDYERWRFSNIGAISGATPWRNIHRPTLSLAFLFSPANDWKANIAPSIGVSMNPGASTRNSLTYGTVASLTHSFSRDLKLGGGVGLFNTIEEVRAFPFMTVDWQINDTLRLKNPFHAGPVGPAGLELIWSHKKIRTGLGGAWRSTRFRLSRDNNIPSGIVTNEFMVGFIRLHYQHSRKLEFDLLGGGLFNGRLTTDDSEGNSIGKTGYETAPFLAMTLSGKF